MLFQADKIAESSELPVRLSLFTFIYLKQDCSNDQDYFSVYKTIYIYIYTHTHTHIYIYIYTHIYILSCFFSVINLRLKLLISAIPAPFNYVNSGRLVIDILSICPELLTPYLTSVSGWFKPRDTEFWYKSMNFLRQVTFMI